jgi:hypothetical protein
VIAKGGRFYSRLLIGVLSRFTRYLGYEIRPAGEARQGFIDARSTLAAAEARGMSVGEYVETIWNQRGATARVIDEVDQVVNLPACKHILEIGPGTGRYLAHILDRTTPKRYEIYETADDWASWLTATYAPPVVRQPADGSSLQHTADGACDLVHAHGVFVYLKFLHCFEYFTEMMRVCAPNGNIAFDIYPTETFDEDAILRWLTYPDRYPVVLDKEQVVAFFANRGFNLVHQFSNPYGHGTSHYLIFDAQGRSSHSQ